MKIVDIFLIKYQLLSSVSRFDVSAENTELLIFSKSHIHIYSFFNEIIEDVKQIDLKSLILPIQSHPNAKVITQVLPIHSTLQTAQFIVCFQDQLFYFLVDINQDVLLLSVELPRALCCSWNMEFIYVLKHDGFLCILYYKKKKKKTFYILLLLIHRCISIRI